MLQRSIFAIALAFAVNAQGADASASNPKKDEALKAGLIGTWISPPDSPDYEGISISETYNPDGTYIYREYEGTGCNIIAATQYSRWHVWEGVIITEYPREKTLNEEIVSMDAGRMVLRSLDDGLTFTRTRSTTCAPTTAKK